MESIIKSLEYMTVAASLHDSSGNVIYINPIFCKLFKTTNSEVIPNKLSSDSINVEIESSFDVFEFLNNNLNNIDDFIIRIKFNDDIKIVKINSLMIKNGKDYHILVYDDVTNSMNTKFMYEEIFNNVNIGIVILKTKDGENFVVKDMNPFAEKLDRINKDDVINIDIKNLKCCDEIIETIRNVWKTGIKIEKKEFDCFSIKGMPCWRDIQVDKVSSGEIIILFEDTTILVETKKHFEEYDKLKTSFLSNMSHEIRSPMNSIVGFVDLLATTKDKNTQRNYIEIIKNSAKLLTQLIDDILDMTKIESGKLSINKSNFDVNQIIEELYTTNKPTLTKDIELVKNLPYRSLKLFNDEYRFRQVFNNLMSNAIKLTTKGEIEIGYKKDGDHIVFYVRDTGPGIKEEDKTKIFNRFEQSKENKRLGHGLGLSISYELIKLMGGDIWFESTYGVGSTFYFKLPNNRKLGRKKIEFNIDIDNLDLRGKTILIVEDIEFNTKLLLSYLEPTYANIVTAVDGNDALIKYNENKKHLDLILMDIQLPNMDGKEVTQIIRTIDTDTPIIAQTAYAMKEEVDDIMEYGFDGLIKKPIRKDELLSIINKFI